MKYLYRITALLLIAFIAFSAVPSAFAEGAVSAVQREEDPAAALAGLMTFAGEIARMRKEFAPERSPADPSDP